MQNILNTCLQTIKTKSRNYPAILNKYPQTVKKNRKHQGILNIYQKNRKHPRHIKQLSANDQIEIGMRPESIKQISANYQN